MQIPVVSMWREQGRSFFSDLSAAGDSLTCAHHNESFGISNDRVSHYEKYGEPVLLMSSLGFALANGGHPEKMSGLGDLADWAG